MEVSESSRFDDIITLHDAKAPVSLDCRGFRVTPWPFLRGRLPLIFTVASPTSYDSLYFASLPSSFAPSHRAASFQQRLPRAAAAPGEAGKLRVELCFVDGLGLGGLSHGGLRTDHTKGDFPHAGLVAGKGFGLRLKRGA